MLKPRPLFKLLRLACQPGKHSLGDLAILKADALGATINPDVKAQMSAVVGYAPAIDLAHLLALPPESFGYAYARHMQDNHLQPFTVSGAIAAEAHNNVFALRYAITHDMFHTLLGFDTSYAGEIGVLAFAVAQHYSRSQRFGLWIARWLYPLLAPGQADHIRACQVRGETLGHQARFLLGYRFEEQWERPLADVRLELGLADV